MAVAKSKTKRSKSRKKVDSTPGWDGHEGWDDNKFSAHFKSALQYYNVYFSGKELKPKVIAWMTANKFSKKQIKQFKATHDWRVSATMGSIAANLLKGMPAVRDDHNQGRDVEEWLREAINKVIENGANDKQAKAGNSAKKQTISVQDRMRDVANKMSTDIDLEYEKVIANPKKYDLKSFKPLNMLKTVEAKAAHARIIKSMYDAELEEMEEVVAGTDPELDEAYSHLSKSERKKILNFLKELVGACSMIMQEGKVARAPRTKKPKSKDKLIEKLNYKKSDEGLKIVSINPADIIGASELWVYNVKTRKIGKYVAENIDPKKLGREGTGLSIKGTTIIGFDPKKSIQKTFRKPQEQVPAFMKLGKVKLRTFLDSIKAVDIKLNGRINPDVLLLKAVK